MLEIYEEFQKFNFVVYHDEPHVYYLNGKKADLSATKLIGKFKKPFDSAYWSQKKADDEGITKEEMLARWKLKGDIACEKGTAVHEYAENRLANKVFPYPSAKIRSLFKGEDPVIDKFNTIVPIVDKFIEDCKGRMISIASELVIGDLEYNLGGMIDQVFYNKKSGKIELWDWKTNEKIDSDSKYTFNAPVSHVPSSKLEEYSLQLSLYKHIIEKNTNLKLGDSYLAWFNENNETYQVFKCLDYSSEVVEMINSYRGRK